MAISPIRKELLEDPRPFRERDFRTIFEIVSDTLSEKAIAYGIQERDASRLMEYYHGDIAIPEEADARLRDMAEIAELTIRSGLPRYAIEAVVIDNSPRLDGKSALTLIHEGRSEEALDSIPELIEDCDPDDLSLDRTRVIRWDTVDPYGPRIPKN